MNLKQFSRLVFCFIAVISLASCNDNDTEVSIVSPSKDTRIRSFALDAKSINALDSLTYPTMRKTSFSVQIDRIGESLIYNNDSLPYGIDIRTMQVKVEFMTSPAKIELIYADKNNSDSLVEWNTTDSVKFVLSERVKDKKLIVKPQFKLTAQDGQATRTYNVDLRIHKIDPDLIPWEQQENFSLAVKGESKTVLNENGDTFYTLTNDGSKVHFYTSTVTTPNWGSAQATDLPKKTRVKSLHLGNDLFAVVTEDGKSYTSPLADGTVWTQTANIQSIVGVLPEIQSRSAEQEYLITELSEKGEPRFAKTKDFVVITPIESTTTLPTNTVPKDFPVRDFSSFIYNGYLVVTGGYTATDEVIKKSWLIKNNAQTSINVFYGANNHIFPYENGISSFVYDDMIYALANDTLYTTKSTGDIWARASKKTDLAKEMSNKHMPSILVDKENYIWVFGGVAKDKKTYSQDVWRGRINRLIPKK